MAEPAPYTGPFDEFGNPIATQEGRIATRLQADLLRQTGNAAAASIAANVAPDPALPGPLGYVPFAGEVEGLLGFGHHLGSKAAEVINRTAPTSWGLHIPDPPDFMKTAGEHYANTRDQIQQHIDTYTNGVLPKPDTNTAVGAASDIVGGAIGGGVGLAPASVLNVAPKGTKTLSSFLFPTLEHTPRNVAISTPLGVGTGTLGEIEAAYKGEPPLTLPGGETLVAHPPAPTPATVPPPDPAQVAATPPAASTSVAQVAAHTQPPPPSLSAMAFAPQPAPATDGSLSAAAFGGAPETPAGPTFTQQGNTTVPLWVPITGLLATAAGVGAGMKIARRGAVVGDAERAARFNDPAYAAEKAAYDADVISRGPGSSTLTPPGGTPTPAPVPQGNAVRRAGVAVADAAVNPAAKMQDVMRMTAPDPGTGERLAAMVGNKYDTALHQNKVSEFLRTGHDERTGMTIPAMKDVLDDFARLKPDQQTTLSDGLKSLNELDNRRNNLDAWKRDNPGKTPTPQELEGLRHDFMGRTDAELHGMAANMRADTDLAVLEGKVKGITDGLLKMGNHQNYGFIQTNELRDILTKHPNYIPEVDINGKPIHPLGERDTTPYTGQAQSTTNAIRDLADHVERLYPLFERNLSNQEIMYHFRGVQQQYPQAAQFMQDLGQPNAQHTSYYPVSGLGDMQGQTRDPIVTVRTGSGIQRMRVDNPVVHAAMTSESRAANNVRMDTMAKLRRMYTQGTTGLVSVATGRAIPMRNAAYTAVAAPVMAPKNMYGGMLDRQIQRATGHTSSVARGLDMLANVPAVAGSYARDVMDRRVGDLGKMLDRSSPNSINRELRSLAGHNRVDAISQMAKDYWKRSDAAWVHSQATVGQGSPMQFAAPGVKAGTKAGPFADPFAMTRSEAARLSPQAYFKGEWMGAKPALINLQRVLGEAFNHMSDAGHDYFMKLNRDNPNISPEQLTYETRNLVGNASRVGSSAAAQVAAKALPYSNVSTQGVARAMRAIGERPAGAPVTMAVGLGTMALLSIMSHMRSGAHMDTLQNNLSLQQREANVALALNDDPNKPTLIPLPQELRAAYAFTLDVVSKAVNMIAARHDPVSFQNLWDGITHFLGSHVTTSNALAMRHGAVDTMDFINIPPMLGHMDWNTSLSTGNIGAGYQPVIGGPARGQVDSTAESPLDTKAGKTFEDILSTAFGAVAHVLDPLNAMMRYHSKGHPWWDSMGMAGRDWLQTARESNPMLNNMLWETPIRLSKQPPIAETVQPVLYALKQLPPMPNMAREGFTPGNAFRLPIPQSSGGPAVSPDPLIRQMLGAAHGYTARINQAMAPVVASKQQMGTVEKQAMDPQARREWLNQQTRIIADQYKLPDQYIADMNNTLSRLAGKAVRVQDIDWSKGREQFAK